MRKVLQEESADVLYGRKASPCRVYGCWKSGGEPNERRGGAKSWNTYGPDAGEPKKKKGNFQRVLFSLPKLQMPDDAAGVDCETYPQVATNIKLQRSQLAK